MVLDGKSLQEYPVNAGVPQRSHCSDSPFLKGGNKFQVLPPEEGESEKLNLVKRDLKNEKLIFNRKQQLNW